MCIVQGQVKCSVEFGHVKCSISINLSKHRTRALMGIINRSSESSFTGLWMNRWTALCAAAGLHLRFLWTETSSSSLFAGAQLLQIPFTVSERKASPVNRPFEPGRTSTALVLRTGNVLKAFFFCVCVLYCWRSSNSKTNLDHSIPTDAINTSHHVA